MHFRKLLQLSLEGSKPVPFKIILLKILYFIGNENGRKHSPHRTEQEYIV